MIITACMGFQSVTIKDNFENFMYLFSDGTVRFIPASDALQSRIMIDMINSTHGGFRSQDGKYLKSSGTEWGPRFGNNKFFEIEIAGEFVSFKNASGNYWITNENGEFLPGSSNLTENGNFTIKKICSYGKQIHQH